MKKTALVFSGGGSRGSYEIGVWKALNKLKIKPDMVFGSSVGAINAALFASNSVKKSAKLWQELETDTVFDLDIAHILENVPDTFKDALLKTDIIGMPAEEILAYAREIVTKGGAGSTGLRKLLDTYISEPAIRKINTLFGITVTEYPSLDGHYLYLDDIPEGELIDYILASASCFPALQKCRIGEKLFIDGGYRDNFPVHMALEQGATTIIAVDLQTAGFVRRDIMKKAREEAEEFHMIESHLDLGNFLVFDRNNTAKLIDLGYFDTMKHWGKYDGDQYTFKKGEFTPHELEGAEAAADILDLDPVCVYNKKGLKTMLARAIENLETDLDTLTFKEILQIIKSEPKKLKPYPQFLIAIARDLKEKEHDSFFMQPAVFKILEDEVQAANYLIQENLI